MVTCLIREGAAVHLPSPAPRILVVVTLITTPTNSNCAHDHFTESAGLKFFTQFYYWNVEAILFDDEESRATFFTSCDHAIGICQSQSHWFFNDDVFFVGS
ncbi:hypothetical protein D3C87_1690430 [compost metagenome]